MPQSRIAAKLANAVVRSAAPQVSAGPGMLQLGRAVYPAPRDGGLRTTLLYLKAVTRWTDDGTTGDSLGAEKYAARVMMEPDARVSLSTDLAAADFGNASSGAQVYAFNPAGIGQSGHSLPYNTSSSFVLGEPYTTASDGRVVYRITSSATSSDWKLVTLGGG